MWSGPLVATFIIITTQFAKMLLVSRIYRSCYDYVPAADVVVVVVVTVVVAVAGTAHPLLCHTSFKW